MEIVGAVVCLNAVLGYFNLTKANLINAVLFQGVWLGCVVGGGVYGLLWPGVLALVILVASISGMPCRRQDVLMAMLALPAGLLLDSLWIQLGVLDFHGATYAPSWILLMWIGVALTINHSLVMLRDRPLLGAIVVALFGPVAYIGGHKLGAVIVPEFSSLWMVGLSWGLLFGLLFVIAQRGLARWSVDYAVEESAEDMGAV